MGARFDGVIFDVDGTLMNSCEGIWEAMRYVAAHMDIDLTGVDMTRYLGPTLQWIYTDMGLAPEKIPQAVDMYRKRYLQVGIRMATPYEGVSEMLHTLHDAGMVMAIASCKLTEQAEWVIRHHRFGELFAYVGGASADGTITSKKDVIEQVLRQPQFAGRRLLMVGDRKDDVLGARQCGIPVVGVSYGYAHPGELQQAGADMVLDSCPAITRYILNG